MEIYQLRAFVTAARLGNLTRTAESLHLTQPAITAQIKALEEELGVALFDRRPGRIALTKAGESLLAEADQVLLCAARLLSSAQQLQGQVTGSLVLGTVDEPDVLRLGRTLGALVQALPLLEIRTRVGLSEELRGQVGTGLLQAAFHIGDSMPGDVAGMALQTLHYRIAAPIGWSERVLRAGWADLAAMPWIGAPPQHHVQVLRSGLFARRGLQVGHGVESDETGLALSLVRNSVGLALLREDVAMQASGRAELVIWPHARVPAQLSLIHSPAVSHEPAMVAMLSVLRQVWTGAAAVPL